MLCLYGFPKYFCSSGMMYHDFIARCKCFAAVCFASRAKRRTGFTLNAVNKKHEYNGLRFGFRYNLPLQYCTSHCFRQTFLGIFENVPYRSGFKLCSGEKEVKFSYIKIFSDWKEGYKLRMEFFLHESFFIVCKHLKKYDHFHTFK